MIRTPMPCGSRALTLPFLLPAILLAVTPLGGCAHQVTRLPHDCRGLADCLTWVAALDDQAASVSAQRNELAPPPVNGGQVAAATLPSRSEPGADQPIVE